MLIFGILLFLFMAVVRSVFAACELNHNLPDPGCSPGSTFENVTKEQICHPGYSATVRDVSSAKKRQILQDYGINPKEYSCRFHIDHLISLQIGGDNADTNLYPLPQPIKTQKDILENKVKKMYCNGELTLEQAQESLSNNWIAAYYKYGLNKFKKFDIELWEDFESVCPKKQ